MESFLVSLTRLRVRSWRYVPLFFVEAFRSARQATSAQGAISVAVLRDARNTFWTRTVWTSEQAMKSFMLVGPHGRVMKHLMEWCDEAAVAHWSQESLAPPSWEEAHRQLVKLGRRSKVNYPSQDQRENRIPAADARSMRELRFK